MTKLDASLIADLPPFAGMNREALTRFLEKACPVRRDKEQYFFKQNTAAHAFFLLLDGHVRVVKTTIEGEQIIARYIPNGELFGIATAVGRDTYPADSIAAVECLALSWPTDMWDTFVAANPILGKVASQTVGARLMDAQERIIEMATERVEQRVATTLCRLIQQSGKETKEGIQIGFPISRQDISEMTGTTLHTVSRLLSAWERAGVVKSGRQKVVVTSSQDLERIAERSFGP